MTTAAQSLDQLAQGLGLNDFVFAVDAYNAEHGTDNTAGAVKDALDQQIFNGLRQERSSKKRNKAKHWCES